MFVYLGLVGVGLELRFSFLILVFGSVLIIVLLVYSVSFCVALYKVFLAFCFTSGCYWF